MTNPPVISVENLSVKVRRGDARTTIVDSISFDVAAGETLAIVGESGCGKSMTALGLMRLAPRGFELSGRVHVQGRELSALSDRQFDGVRGRDIGMVFQDPFSSLNPVITVGEQITDVIVRHDRASWSEARRQAVRLLERVRIPDPETRASNYPHQFSGGMRQRAAIAVALAARPKVLVADEPTTALDVTVQSQIMKLLATLQSETGMALVLTSHDLAMVAETADRVLVMYAGRKVEEQSVWTIFDDPQHPYTTALMNSRPKIGSHGHPLAEIKGVVPPLDAIPPGCAFEPRCSVAIERCRQVRPELQDAGAGMAACWRPTQARHTEARSQTA